MKKTICLILSLVMLFSCINSAFADSDAIRQHMQSNYSKALTLSKRSNFNGYCAVCVAYQLMAFGIVNKYVIGHGKDSFDNYSAMNPTSGGWYTRSYPAHTYSMKYVLESVNTFSFGQSYYPIVFGFTKGTASSAGQTYGHTLMVYAVRGGTVYFTDSTMPLLSDNIYSLTIDEFCARYSDNPATLANEFVYEGAVQFYKSAPDSADIKAAVVSGSDVEIRFSSPGATQYSMALYKDGVRADTIHTQLNHVNLKLLQPGRYSAFVTACNVYGYLDSYSVDFIIGSSPQSGVISSNKYTVASGEEVTLFCSADYATSYAIGITYPDLSFKAVHADSSGMYITSFEQPGVYTIYASCCNFAGYIDTQPITIQVY